MDIDILFKIAALGIVISIIHKLLVQSGREEQALMVTILGLVIVMIIVVDKIYELFVIIKSLFDI
ncbi:MAG: stage III sporulation protein AC [Clostridia bacterium]|nr:stage III sporulation protein AC [Clostridia bacterium]